MASTACVPRQGDSPENTGIAPLAKRPNNQPPSAKAPAMPAVLPRLTISIARPRWAGPHRSAVSDNAAVRAPVVPVAVKTRAANSITVPVATAVSAVPRVQTSARPIISRTRLMRSTRIPTGIEHTTSASAALAPWISPNVVSVSRNSAFTLSCTVANEPIIAKPIVIARVSASSDGRARPKPSAGGAAIGVVISGAPGAARRPASPARARRRRAPVADRSHGTHRGGRGARSARRQRSSDAHSRYPHRRRGRAHRS